MNRLLSFLLLVTLGQSAAAQDSAPEAQRIILSHAIAMYDEPKYPADFTHFDYVNPDAPKGGTLHNAGFGSFDSFNPFIVSGDPAGLAGLYETLTTQIDDDTLSEYGLIAETMEVAKDNSWIIFK